MKQSWTFMLLPAVNHMSSNRAKIGSRTVVASLHFPSSIGIAHCSKVAMYASTGDVEKSDRGTQLAAPISNAASLTSAELMKLKVPALKELCRSRKLLVSGTKAVLVDRLLVWASNALESKPKEDVSALARPLKSTDSLKTKGINGGAGNVESSSHGADTEQPQEGDVVEVVGDNGVVYRAIWTAKQVFTKNDSGEAVPDTKLILVLDLPEPPPPLPPRSRANTDAISKLTQLVRLSTIHLPRNISTHRRHFTLNYVCAHSSSIYLSLWYESFIYHYWYGSFFSFFSPAPTISMGLYLQSLFQTFAGGQKPAGGHNARREH